MFGGVSTGAADDLNRASALARDMATRFGMVPELGEVTYDRTPASFLEPTGAPGKPTCSEETSREIDRAVRSLVSRAADRAERILSTNRALLERGARVLLERETLAGEDLARLAGDIHMLEQAA